MQRMPLFMIIAVTVTAGCGQKGPLVLPDARTATPVVRPASAPGGAPRPASEAVPAPPATPTQDKKKRPE